MTHSITRTVNDVCKGALYLSGIVARNQPANGWQINECVDILNEIIDELNGCGVTIPYYTEYEFSLIAGRREYHFTPSSSGQSYEITSNLLAELVTVQLQQADIKYPVRVNDINSVDLHDVVTQSQARPEVVALERYVNDGFGTGEPYSKVYFYPFPDQAYTCFIRAKAQIDYVQNSDVLTNLPPQLHRFLKYALGRELVGYYQVSQNWTAQKEETYQKLFDLIMPSTDFDLTIQNTGILRRNGRFYTRRITSG